MLSNLANYLLGYGDNASENAATGGSAPATAAAAAAEGDDMRLTTVETEEDDWLMVETSRDGERRSSTASLPNMNLEESWFVTPPPCFTSTGPVTVETSPLENLLIEHPSMSVYHRGPRSSSPQRPQRARSLSPARPVQARLRAPLQPRELHNLQVQAFHQAQKHQLIKESQVMRTKQMERQNKARDVNKRNKRQRRADRQKNHSGANNNRKCC
uniref:Tumor protein p53-inducible nuclear protein 1 n=1 Tax=Lygus hesperus TaxID=30085 RepID=A0A0A9WLF6_LYGHE